MSEERKINEKEFMVAVEALNTYLKTKEKEEIKIEGLSIEDQIQAFLNPIIEAAENNTAGELPAEVIEFYNNHLADDEPEEEPEKKPEEKPKKEKKAKKEKKEKKPKKTVEKDAYGCTVGSGANKINMLAEKGMTIKDIIQEVGTTRSRVQSHFASLKKKGFFIDNIDGVFYLLTEEPPERPKPEKKPKKAKKTKKETPEADVQTEIKTEEKKEEPKKKTTPKKKTSSKTSTKTSTKKSTKKGK